MGEKIIFEFKFRACTYTRTLSRSSRVKEAANRVFRAMRITVEDVLRWLASGMSFQDILADFPELTQEDLVAALEFAAMRQQRTVIAA